MVLVSQAFLNDSEPVCIVDFVTPCRLFVFSTCAISRPSFERLASTPRFDFTLPRLIALWWCCRYRACRLHCTSSRSLHAWLTSFHFALNGCLASLGST